MLEIWRDVIDYYGLYEVSNFGRVRSWYDTHGNRRVEPMIIGGYDNGTGYLLVCLYKDKKQKRFLIHRLVCESFILGRKMRKGEFCDHINTVRHDNRLENLRVCSHKQNCNNPITCKKRSEFMSKCMKGKTIRAIPLTLRGVKDGSIYNFNSSYEASRYFDYKDERTIGGCISKARKTGKRTIKIHGEEYYYSQSEK